MQPRDEQWGAFREETLAGPRSAACCVLGVVGYSTASILQQRPDGLTEPEGMCV